MKKNGKFFMQRGYGEFKDGWEFFPVEKLRKVKLMKTPL